MIGEVSPDHRKCHADHFSKQPGSGSLQVCSSGQAVNFIFILEFWKIAGMPLSKNKGIGKQLETTPQNALCHTSLTVWQCLVYNQIPATTFPTSPFA